MKKFKRLIALVTVAMFIFSFAAPAFAADAATSKAAIGADVKGTKYEKDAMKLIALGVINGFEDGTVRPDSEVTRAQFAAIVAQELGIADGALQGPTKFKDLPADHWASGLVNLAVGRGIIQGYPDGTFRPEAPVTYAEAYAMLVQMLGYGKALAGAPWPTGVVAKAASLGVSKGVSGAANVAMKRGDVIIAAANSLTIDIMEQTTWGDENRWSEVSKTILEDYLDYTIYDDDATNDDNYPKVNAVPRFNLSGMDGNEIEFANVSGTFTVPEYINPDEFFGQEVEFWANEDKEIVYIGLADDAEVYTDVIESATNGTDDEIKLDTSNKTYKIASDAVFYKNIKDTDLYGTDAAALALAGRNIKIVLNDDDKVAYGIITEYYTNDDTSMVGVVNAIDTDDETIEFQGDDLSDLELDDVDYVIYKGGAKVDLADLKKDDLLNILIDTDDDEYYIVATANKVEGKVTDVRYNSASAINSFDIYVGDKKYDVAGYTGVNPVTYSDDENDTFGTITASNLKDLKNNNATLYLDADGKVIHVLTGETESSAKVGVITKDALVNSYGDEIKLNITNDQGQEVTYTFDPDDVTLKLNGTEQNDPNAADFVNALTADSTYADNFLPVEFELDSAGKLAEINVVTNDYTNDTTVSINKDDDTIALAGGDFRVTNDTKIFDMTGTYTAPNFDDVKVVVWTSVENGTLANIYYSTNEDEVEYLFILDGSVSSDNEYGVIKGFTTDDDGDDAVILLLPNGEEKTIRSENANTATSYIYDATTTLAKGQFIQYTTDADGIDDVVILAANKSVSNQDITNLAAVDIDAARYVKVTSATATSIKGKLVTGTASGSIAGTDAYYTVNADTKYLEIFDNAALDTATGVSKNDIVLMIDTDDDGATADYVIVVGEDFDTFTWTL